MFLKYIATYFRSRLFSNCYEHVYFNVGHMTTIVSSRPTSMRSRKWTRSSSTPSRSWWGCPNWRLNKLKIWTVFCFYSAYFLKIKLYYNKFFKCFHLVSLTIFVFKDVCWRERTSICVEVLMLKSWRRRCLMLRDGSLSSNQSWLIELLRRTNNILFYYKLKRVLEFQWKLKIAITLFLFIVGRF